MHVGRLEDALSDQQQAQQASLDRVLALQQEVISRLSSLRPAGSARADSSRLHSLHASAHPSSRGEHAAPGTPPHPMEPAEAARGSAASSAHLSSSAGDPSSICSSSWSRATSQWGSVHGAVQGSVHGAAGASSSHLGSAAPPRLGGAARPGSSGALTRGGASSLVRPPLLGGSVGGSSSDVLKGSTGSGLGLGSGLARESKSSYQRMLSNTLIDTPAQVTELSPPASSPSLAARLPPPPPSPTSLPRRYPPRRGTRVTRWHTHATRRRARAAAGAARRG